MPPTIALAERPIDALVVTFQTHLGTELALIDAENADDIVLAVPGSADYYKYPKPEIAGSPVHVEVYEEAFDFFDVTMEVQRASAWYPLVVRITFFNTTAERADAMMKRMRRYGAAAVRVLLKYPQLTGLDQSIQGLTTAGVLPFWELDAKDSNKVVKVRTAVRCRVRCEEVAA